MVVSPEESSRAVSLTETTRYAVLGLVLREGQVHGYAVRGHMQRWGLAEEDVPSEGRVYRALEWLYDEQLIVPESQTVVDLRAAVGAETAQWQQTSRREYAPTELGAERFETWLRSPLVAEADLLWRVGAARAQDLPILRGVVLDAWVEWMRRVQDHPVTDVGALVSRQAEWPTSRATLLSILRAKMQMGHAEVLREMAEVLDGMPGPSGREMAGGHDSSSGR